MSPNEVKNFLSEWPMFSSKIFLYQQEFWPDEYVMITKNGQDDFKLNKDDSTCDVDLSDPTNIVTLLQTGKLQITRYWGTSTLKLKTGGCTCGSWIVKDALHYDYCDVKKRYITDPYFA